MLAMDFRIHCPECDHEIWGSEVTKISRGEFEWECPKCQRSVYREILA